MDSSIHVFDLYEYRKILLSEIKIRNEKESKVYSDFSRDYKDIFLKYQAYDGKTTTTKRGDTSDLSNSENIERFNKYKNTEDYPKIVDLVNLNAQLTQMNTELNEQKEKMANRMKELEDIIRGYEEDFTNLKKSLKTQERLNELMKKTIASKNLDFEVVDVVFPNKTKDMLKAHESKITSIQLNSTSILTCSTDKTVKLWDVNKMKETKVLNCFSSGVSCANFTTHDSKEEFIFAGTAGSTESQAVLWSLKTNKQVATFKGHSDNINACFSSSSVPRGYTSSLDKTVKEWDFSACKLSRNFDCHTPIFALSGTLNNRTLFSGCSDGSINILSIESGKIENTVKLFDDKLSQIVTLNDGNCVLCSSKGSIKQIDLRKITEPVYSIKSECIKEYRGSNLSLMEDKFFAVGTHSGEVLMFDIKYGNLLGSVQTSNSLPITSLQWLHQSQSNLQLILGDLKGFLTVLKKE